MHVGTITGCHKASYLYEEWDHEGFVDETTAQQATTTCEVLDIDALIGGAGEIFAHLMVDKEITERSSSGHMTIGACLLGGATACNAAERIEWSYPGNIG